MNEHAPLHPIEMMAAGELALLCGNYNLGWRMYESRLHPIMHPRVPRFEERITRLEGKVVMLRAELGAGDNFMMMRYFPVLAKHSKCRVLVLEAPPGMDELYAAFIPDYVIVPYGAPRRTGVVELPVMSLPLLCSPFLGWRPADPLPPRVAGPRHGIGIVPACEVRPDGKTWRGNKRHQKNPTADLLHQLEAEFGPFVSLLHADLGHCSWLETAERMAGLELVISVDSGPAHLAATLGIETWVLQRHRSQSACWRWGSPDPWYPGTARVFQQTQPGDWSGPIEAVREALRVR